MHIKKSHKGLLHKTLGVPQGHKIPMATLEKAMKSPNAKTRQRANFAINARGFKHK